MLMMAFTPAFAFENGGGDNDVLTRNFIDDVGDNDANTPKTKQRSGFFAFNRINGASNNGSKKRSSFWRTNTSVVGDENEDVGDETDETEDSNDV